MKIRKILLAFFALLIFNQLHAQTTLTAGDLAIVLVNMDNPDEVSVVALTTIASGTTINLTDNGWLSSGSFRSGEGTDSYTFTSAATCGDIISIPVNNMALSASGDQVLIYQGTAASPTFVTAINVEGSAVWQTNATNSNTSALPTGLTNGTDAVAVTELDNVTYTGTTTGTVASLKTALFTSSNFTGSNSTRQTAPASFTVSGGCAVPVELISFTASALNNQVSLEWSTASELNNHYFEIEKSLDGKEFTTIGRVEGNGNSRSIIDYNFIDYNLSKTSYYRLKQVDFDGQFEYSDIVAIKNIEHNLELLKQTSTSFTLNADLDTRVIVTNQRGQVESDNVISNTMIINKRDYSYGIYFIQAMNSEGVQTIKWINAQ